MSVSILRPFEGERVLGVSPTPAARVHDWNRRLNLFTGRALSEGAFTSEQNGTGGRLALRGQGKSPGVIAGLNTGLENAADGNFFLHVSPGFGTTASGEDVSIPTPLRVNVQSISAYAPVAAIAGNPESAPGVLLPRKIGASLGEIITGKLAVPQTGIVLLQPIVTDTLANFDATDQCEEDPSSDAFADEQLIDGCRVIYYAWPTEWLPMPAPGDLMRNRMAYRIFEREGTLDANVFLPWEEVGLPIALLSFDQTWKPLFIDRSSVVREGGKPKRRTQLVPGSGNPFLWQARILQFGEQVTDADLSHITPDDLAAEFQFVPPVGLLPKTTLAFQTSAEPGVTSRVAGSRFFGNPKAVTTVPVPLEQLDAIVSACASLQPLNLFALDALTVVVPVPQSLYEPDLLDVRAIDPIFQSTVDNFSHNRAIWLKRRQDIRKIRSALSKAKSGTTVLFPDPDPDAVEVNEEIAGSEIDPQIAIFASSEESFGTEPGQNEGDPAVGELTKFRASLAGVPGLADELPELDKPGVGLEQFMELLRQKADAANDQIDLGFLRVQTDIYRTRQNMLGNEAGTRLAISPALASIAQGQSALATRDDLVSFLARVKQNPTGPVPAAAPIPPLRPRRQQKNSNPLCSLPRRLPAASLLSARSARSASSPRISSGRKRIRSCSKSAIRVSIFRPARHLVLRPRFSMLARRRFSTRVLRFRCPAEKMCCSSGLSLAQRTNCGPPAWSSGSKIRRHRKRSLIRSRANSMPLKDFRIPA